MVEGGERFCLLRGLFRQFDFPHFQFSDLLFIGINQRVAISADNPFHELVGLFLKRGEFGFCMLRGRFRSVAEHFPAILHHPPGDMEQVRRRLELFEQRLELTFDLFLADVLAALRAAFGLAKIVRIMRTAPFRPGGCHGLPAAGTTHKPPKREIRIQVFAGRSRRLAFKPGLYPLEGLKADQGLMLARFHMDVPFFDRDVSGIGWPFEHIDNRLEAGELAASSLCLGMAMQEALHFRHGLEPARSKALQSLAGERRFHLIGHEHFAVTGHRGIAIAEGRPEHEISVLKPCLHLLDNLSPVLHALKLALRGEDGFDKLAFRGVVECVVETFHPRATQGEGLTQLEVKLPVAGKALQIIEDHDKALARLGIEKAQQGHHAGAVHEIPAPAGIIGKHRIHRIAFEFGILAAAILLTVEAVAFRLLSCARHAAIDERVPWQCAGLNVFCCHASSSLSSGA